MNCLLYHSTSSWIVYFITLLFHELSTLSLYYFMNCLLYHSTISWIIYFITLLSQYELLCHKYYMIIVNSTDLLEAGLRVPCLCESRWMVGTLREINLSNQRSDDDMFSLRTGVLYRFANSSRMSCLISIFLIKHRVEDGKLYTWTIIR